MYEIVECKWVGHEMEPRYAIRMNGKIVMLERRGILATSPRLDILVRNVQSLLEKGSTLPTETKDLGCVVIRSMFTFKDYDDLVKIKEVYPEMFI